jgi:hypothetical protein
MTGDMTERKLKERASMASGMTDLRRTKAMTTENGRIKGGPEIAGAVIH